MRFFIIYCHGAAFYIRQGLWLGRLRVSLGDAAGIWGTPMGAWFHQGCPLSPILFLVSMYRVTRCSQGVCPIWEPQDYISAFGHDVVLLPSSVDELQHALERFAAEYEAAEMWILMVLCQKTMGCLLWVGGVGDQGGGGLGILRLLLERFQACPSGHPGVGPRLGEHLRVPREELENFAGENKAWNTMPSLLPPLPNLR